MGNGLFKNSVVGHSVNSDQQLCALNTCNVQESELAIDKENQCTGMNQRLTVMKPNTQYMTTDFNTLDPSLPQLLIHKHPLKIFHQNIRSLRYKMNELICHLNHASPHILCITEHHLCHEELAALHAENYVLGSSYSRKSKQKGGVCIFVHKSLKFTPLIVDEYCTDQDFEVCAIHPKSSHDKLCILAIYRSPNFNTFLTNLDLILHKFFNLNFNFVVMWGH